MAQILKTRRASKGIFTNASQFVLLMLLLLSSISHISSAKTTTSASNLKFSSYDLSNNNNNIPLQSSSSYHEEEKARVIVKKFESSNSRSSNDLCIKYINNKSEDKFVFRRMKHNKIKRNISNRSSSSNNNSPKIIDNSLLKRKILSFDNKSKAGFNLETRLKSYENINDSRDNEEVENISATNFRTTFEKASETTIDKTHESSEQSDRFDLFRDINGEYINNVIVTLNKTEKFHIIFFNDVDEMTIKIVSLSLV